MLSGILICTSGDKRSIQYVYMSSNTIKLTVDARMLNHSGIGTYIRNLLPGLSSSMSMHCIVGENGNTIISNFQPGKASKAAAGIYSVKEQLQLPNLIAPCDVFWSPHYNIPVAPIAARRRLVTIHDVFHLAYYNQLSLKQKLYAKLVLSLAVRLSDTIITVSDFSKQEIIKYTGARPDKIQVIHNGVDAARFQATLPPQQSALIREKYKLPEKYILYTGLVKAHKNLQRLLQAYRLMLRKANMQSFHLVLCGKYEGFITGNTDLPSYIASLGLEGKVTMAGYVDEEDLPHIYQMASLFVFPSLYEGFGFPPLEAMASQCPVVVSRAASLPEVCGDAAVYIDPYSVESITEGMLQVLSNPQLRDTLIQKGKERIKLFSWQQSLAAHEQLISKLAMT